jgi:hypothetical protein
MQLLFAPMDPHHLVRLLSVGRVLVGGALLVAPRVAGGGWFGPAASEGATQVAIRALGIRDLVLGLATYRALDRGDDLDELLALGVACDAVDALATARSLHALPTKGALATLAVATEAAAMGLFARQQLRAG